MVSLCAGREAVVGKAAVRDLVQSNRADDQGGRRVARPGAGRLGGDRRLGQEGVTMPAKGRIETRDYDATEREALAAVAAERQTSVDALCGLLGASTCDVFLNDRAYWRNVPSNVWEYTIGGYQVMKKWLSYRERGILGRDLKPDEGARGDEHGPPHRRHPPLAAPARRQLPPHQRRRLRLVERQRRLEGTNFLASATWASRLPQRDPRRFKLPFRKPIYGRLVVHRRQWLGALVSLTLPLTLDCRCDATDVSRHFVVDFLPDGNGVRILNRRAAVIQIIEQQPAPLKAV